MAQEPHLPYLEEPEESATEQEPEETADCSRSEVALLLLMQVHPEEA